MNFTFKKNHPLLWCYLFFLYFSFVPQILIYSTGTSISTGLRQAILMSLLWLIPILLFPKHIKLITALLGPLLWIGGITSLGYWLVFGQEFSQSVIFIIFESNFSEGSEFLISYFRFKYIFFLLLYSIAPIILWKSLPASLVIEKRPRLIYLTVFVLITSWPFTNTWLVKGEGLSKGVDHLYKRIEPSAPWNLIVGYIKYREQLHAVEQNLANIANLKPLENLTEKNADQTKTLVLVIGESTNRQRLGLYGYQRETTPKLSAIKDELVVFDDVITSRPYTIEALQQALSFGDAKSPEAMLGKPTLLNLMKQAGYEITWITNQQTQTKRNTILTTFSKLADHQVYLNNNRTQNGRQYDGAVLKPFAETLQTSAKKKFIVVHLLGTHRKYDFRYPKEYDVFNTEDKVPSWVIESGNTEEYNNYDNSVLYNDFVIAELINTLKQHQENSLLVYFSDHGEEVYDYPEKLFCGRNEAAPTPAMYTIPFIAWANEGYRSTSSFNDWHLIKSRPYTTADFIYTWSDMAGISYKEMDYSRSLVSTRYINHPRWIGNPDAPKTVRDYAQIDFQFKTDATQTVINYNANIEAKQNEALFSQELLEGNESCPSRKEHCGMDNIINKTSKKTLIN